MEKDWKVCSLCSPALSVVILIARWALNNQTIHSARNRLAPSILFWAPFYIYVQTAFTWHFSLVVRWWIRRQILSELWTSAGLKRLLSVLKGLLARHQSMRLHRIIPYNHNTRLKKHIVGSLLVQCWKEYNATTSINLFLSWHWNANESNNRSQGRTKNAYRQSLPCLCAPFLALRARQTRKTLCKFISFPSCVMWRFRADA